ncbi:hypothetical protein V2J09_008511 [Rumex salicifolius]
MALSPAALIMPEGLETATNIEASFYVDIMSHGCALSMYCRDPSNTCRPKVQCDLPPSVTAALYYVGDYKLGSTTVPKRVMSTS